MTVWVGVTKSFIQASVTWFS